MPLRAFDKLAAFLRPVAAFAGFICLSTLGASAQSPGVTDDTILLGGIGPLTGPASWVGLGARDGFMLALDEISVAPIHGRKIKIIWEDDGGTPSGAFAAAKKLVEREKVFAIFSGQTSNGAVALIDYLSDNKVPFFNTTAASDKLVNPLRKNIFIGASMPQSRTGEGVVSLAIDYHKAKRPAMLSPSDEQGKSFAIWQEKWFNERGVQVVAKAEHAAGDADFTGQLVQIKASNPDILVLASAIPAASIILRQARELGFTIPIIGGSSSTGAALPQAAGPAAEGYQSAWLSPYFLSDPAPENQEFLKKYRSKYSTTASGRPNYPDYFGYADAFVIAESLRRAGRDVTREKFITALESLKDFRGTPVASLRNFSPENHVGNADLSFLVVKNGQFATMDFHPIIKSK